MKSFHKVGNNEKYQDNQEKIQILLWISLFCSLSCGVPETKKGCGKVRQDIILVTQEWLQRSLNGYAVKKDTHPNPDVSMS